MDKGNGGREEEKLYMPTIPYFIFDLGTIKCLICSYILPKEYFFKIKMSSFHMCGPYGTSFQEVGAAEALCLKTELGREKKLVPGQL